MTALIGWQVQMDTQGTSPSLLTTQYFHQLLGGYPLYDQVLQIILMYVKILLSVMGFLLIHLATNLQERAMPIQEFICIQGLLEPGKITENIWKQSWFHQCNQCIPTTLASM